MRDDTPSVEGVLLSRWLSDEYRVAIPALITEPGANIPLDSRFLVIPRERVAFYEVLA